MFLHLSLQLRILFNVAKVKSIFDITINKCKHNSNCRSMVILRSEKVVMWIQILIPNYLGSR